MEQPVWEGSAQTKVTRSGLRQASLASSLPDRDISATDQYTEVHGLLGDSHKLGFGLNRKPNEWVSGDLVLKVLLDKQGKPQEVTLVCAGAGRRSH
ncbi:MAG: hypothetical protein ACJ71Q_20150 [Terriglobales bacterium]